MRSRSLLEIAAATGGRLVGEDATVSSVAVDSREVEPGSLFFAMTGEHGDGHAFIPEAFARGSAGAVVRREQDGEGPVIVVADTGRALLDLAAEERSALGATVIGITGSTGKTCTKDLAASVLGARFEVRASPASYNNEVGVPLTILGADERTEVLVCEMGSRGVGHIAMLCEVVRPTMGVVTNVGVAHLGLFGSKDNIVRSKRELVEALPDDGVAVLNADDRTVVGYAASTRARVATFGVSPEADVMGSDVSLDEEGRAAFTLSFDREQERVELAVPGEHMVTNALGAAACGVSLGLTVAECAAALKGARVSAWRMETFTTSDGVRVVNDAYNANPASMAAALQSARWMARRGARGGSSPFGSTSGDRHSERTPRSERSGRLIVVLGPMAELGEISRQEHERVGELVARLQVDRLITVGPEVREIERAAVREGIALRDVANHATVEEALEDLRAHVERGDVVLIKASRVAGLERVAEALRGENR